VANEQNLIPMDQRSESEAREFGQKGGIASGVARRRKRALRDAADLYLSMPLRDKRRLNAMLRDGLAEEDVDNQMAIIVGLTKMAQMGDHKSAKVLFELLDDGGTGDPASQNNLLEAIRNVEEIDTDDLPEVE
jgi:hypothetical protein